jgi:hypothetical protein
MLTAAEVFLFVIKNGYLDRDFRNVIRKAENFRPDF